MASLRHPCLGRKNALYKYLILYFTLHKPAAGKLYSRAGTVQCGTCPP